MRSGTCRQVALQFVVIRRRRDSFVRSAEGREHPPNGSVPRRSPALLQDRREKLTHENSGGLHQTIAGRDGKLIERPRAPDTPSKELLHTQISVSRQKSARAGESAFASILSAVSPSCVIFKSGSMGGSPSTSRRMKPGWRIAQQSATYPPRRSRRHWRCGAKLLYQLSEVCRLDEANSVIRLPRAVRRVEPPAVTITR